MHRIEMEEVRAGYSKKEWIEESEGSAEKRSLCFQKSEKRSKGDRKVVVYKR